MPNKKITGLVGGTGGYVLAKGLSDYTDTFDVSMIYSTADDGGSARTLVYEFGLLPFSDSIQLIMALSPAHDDHVTDVLSQLIAHRFSNTNSFEGQRTGNLIYAALTEILGSEQKAIYFIAHDLLHIKGHVIPVTYDKSRLVAEYANGKQMKGESSIDVPKYKWQAKHKITSLFYDPPVKANSEAVNRILDSDLIVLGPGDVFTSVLPNVVCDGIAQALRDTDAEIVYVSNLMSKWGQTNHYASVAKLIDVMNSYISTSDNNYIDYCLVNDSDIKQTMSKAYLDYADNDVVEIEDDCTNSHNGTVIVRADVLSDQHVVKAKGDKLSRSLIRHSPEKLAKALIEIIA